MSTNSYLCTNGSEIYVIRRNVFGSAHISFWSGRN